MPLLVGILPSITARKGIAGREIVVKAFEKYFSTEGHKKGSILTKNRYEASAKNGVKLEDIARFEAAGANATLVNTVPAAFWMLFLVYSHSPSLLNELRNEIDAVVTSKVDKIGLVRNLDITSLKTNCPLLTSTYQEVLRYRSMGTSVRQVMEDTVLDNQYLLRKDCMVQMPSRVLHLSNVWGTDADEFNPKRFMKDKSQNSGGGKRPTAAAFRAFGGGTTLCPGRHFSTNEILAVVTMFVVRYDMKPIVGEWSLPRTDNTMVAAVIMEPDTDVEVEVSPRSGTADERWTFSLGDSKEIFAVVAEDRTD